MKRLLAASAMAAALSTPAFAETKNFDLAGFTRVSASAGVSVTMTVGGDYSVRAESSAEGLDRLKVEIVGDELVIGRKPLKGFRWKRGDEARVFVTAPALSAADVSSGASFTVEGVDAGQFSLDASSGGSLKVSGKCDALTVDVSSGGSISARGLECRSAVADASSGGSADIFASESLMGDASSGGSVSVYGKPQKVSKDTSSGGSVSVE